MTKQLLLMRHAKSSWEKPELSDHERPLSDRGLRDAPLMGRLLAQNHLAPDLIVSSSAVRALATAQRVAQELGYREQLLVAPQLYHTEPDEMARFVSTLPEQHRQILIVGHNPGLEEWLAILTGQKRPMPTAAVALLELPLNVWSELSNTTMGKLQEFWTPKGAGIR
jgi:phosphohistidine phosphatase